MTRRELRKIVYHACERLETCKDIFSCMALERSLFLAEHVTYTVSEQYAKFYERDSSEPWFSGYRANSHIRIMLLLMFLEGKKYV